MPKWAGLALSLVPGELSLMSMPVSLKSASKLQLVATESPIIKDCVPEFIPDRFNMC